MIQYKDIFVEVRQRVAAFKYWQEFLRNSSNETYPYGGVNEDDYLDEAYRFLYTTASKDFLKFCAEKEKMSFDEYCKELGVKQKELI